MKTKGYRYSVHVDLTLTKRDVDLLTHYSERHYDGKCRSASKPGPDAFINGFNNHFAVFEDKGTTKIDVLVTFDQLDTMVKILESAMSCPLYQQCRLALKALADEQRRVNEEGVG